MGTERFLRDLRPDHQVFVVEMGSYGPGDVARLCRMAPPRVGIMTAVGPAHLERFGTVEAIARTDYELIAERDPRIQQASAALNWSGSWYEADVALDPIGREDAGRALQRSAGRTLDRYRRMGHDLAVVCADYVPLFFDGTQPDVGRSYIIEVQGEAVGQVSYSEVDRSRGKAELDIWLRSEGACGRGYGTDALVALTGHLREALGLKRSQVGLLSGQTSRDKRFLIRGVTAEELRRRVQELLGD